MRKLIFTIISIIWMGVIFSYSAKTGVESTNDSFFVSRIIGKIVYSDFGEWSAENQELFLDKMDFLVRKSAHMTEYFILYILAFLSQTNISISKKTLFLPLVITILYAVSDEVHQYFVPNRSCQIRDVIIDSMGGILAVCVVLSINRVRHH